MKHKVEFGFGVGEDASGRLLLQSEVAIGMQKICQHAADLFGGYTITKTQGGWVNPAGRLVEERGITLSALIEIDQVNYLAIVDTIKSALRQHAIVVILTEVAWSVE